MKKDYKMYGFGVAAIMFVLGLYLLGHAGANFLKSNSGVPVDESGQLFSMSIVSMAVMQFAVGFVIVVLGIFLYMVFLHKKVDEEEF